MKEHLKKFERIKSIDKKGVMKRAFQSIYSSGKTSLKGINRIVKVTMLKLTSSRFTLLNSLGEYYKQTLLKKSIDVETLRDVVLYGNEKSALTKLKKLSKSVEAMIALAEIYRKTNDKKTRTSVKKFLQGKSIGSVEEGAKTTIEEIKKRTQYLLWSVPPAYLISAIIGIPTLLTITGIVAYNTYKIDELDKNIKTLSQLSKAKTTRRTSEKPKD